MRWAVPCEQRHGTMWQVSLSAAQPRAYVRNHRGASAPTVVTFAGKRYAQGSFCWSVHHCGDIDARRAHGGRLTCIGQRGDVWLAAGGTGAASNHRRAPSRRNPRASGSPFLGAFTGITTDPPALIQRPDPPALMHRP